MDMHWIRTPLAALAALAVLALIPWRLCAYDAPALFSGDRAALEALARGVEHDVRAAPSPASFATGSARFDGEWLFGTHMMAAMGLAQIALERPELAEQHRALLEATVERMLAPEVSAFDREAWGESALVSLDAGDGHAAYLGYLGLALGAHRLVDPQSRFAELDDRIAGALARRLDRSPIALVETYPGEVYPVDNTAAIAAVALRDRAARSDEHAASIARALDRLRSASIDPRTGLLVQRVERATGLPVDGPRGSGTLLAVYFLAYADLATSRALWDAAAGELGDEVLGFGVMRERPRDGDGGGDIDSGPIAFGYGVSATGFALAGARIHGDAGRYAHLYATTGLFGAPITVAGAKRFVVGGPIGGAILLAALTAPRGGLS
jgi:hypothetical protein